MDVPHTEGGDPTSKDNRLGEATISWFDRTTSDVIRDQSSVIGVGAYIAPVIGIFGIVGNVLALLILRRKGVCAESTSIYLRALAIADICCIVTTSGVLLVGEQFGQYYSAWSDWHCKLESVVIHTAFLGASWLVISITIERFIITVVPLKAKTVCTKKRAIGVVTFLTISLLALWVGLIFRNGVEAGPCIVQEPQYAGFHGDVGVIVASVLYTFLPTPLLFIFNAFIIYNLASASRRRSRLISSQAHESDFKRQTRVTVAVVDLSVCYLVLTIPEPVLRLVQFTADPETINWPLLLQLVNISPVLIVINHSVNFMFYIILSQRMRQECWRIVRCAAGDDRTG